MKSTLLFPGSFGSSKNICVRSASVEGTEISFRITSNCPTETDLHRTEERSYGAGCSRRCSKLQKTEWLEPATQPVSMKHWKNSDGSGPGARVRQPGKSKAILRTLPYSSVIRHCKDWAGCLASILAWSGAFWVVALGF